MERLIKSVAASLIVSASILAPIKTFASPKTVIVQQPRHSTPVRASNRSVSVYRTTSIKTFASPRTVVMQQPRHSPPTQASNRSVGGYGSIATRDDDRLYCANYIVLASSTVKQCIYPSRGR